MLKYKSGEENNKADAHNNVDLLIQAAKVEVIGFEKVITEYNDYVNFSKKEL